LLYRFGCIDPAADSPEGPAPMMTTSRTDIRLDDNEGRKAGRQEGRNSRQEGGKDGTTRAGRWKGGRAKVER